MHKHSLGADDDEHRLAGEPAAVAAAEAEAEAEANNGLLPLPMLLGSLTKRAVLMTSSKSTYPCRLQ